MEITELLVTSLAGKPIYYYPLNAIGDAELASKCMLVTGVVLTTEDLVSVKSKEITTIFYKNANRMILSVKIKNLKIKVQTIQKTLLKLINDQIVSTITLSQIDMIFDREPGYDLRNQLSGTEQLITGLIESYDFPFYEAIKVENLAEKVKLAKAMEEVFSNKGIIFGILLTEKMKVTALATNRSYELHINDFNILLMLLKNSRNNLGETWLPICLPNSVDENAFVQAHISTIENNGYLILVSNLYTETDFHLVSALKDNFSKRMVLKTDVNSELGIFTEYEDLLSLTVVLNTTLPKQQMTFHRFKDKRFEEIYSNLRAGKEDSKVIQMHSCIGVCKKDSRLEIYGIFCGFTKTEDYCKFILDAENMARNNSLKYAMIA